jgi:hypothetical protein
MNLKRYVKYAIAGLGVWVFITGCGSYGKIIKSEPVAAIPDKAYETIIRLDNPDGRPIAPDIGFVYVELDGKVTTDFAREIFVKKLDNLGRYEQLNRDQMGKFVIKDSAGRVRGYYEILFNYRTILWEGKEGILLQIILPDERFRAFGDSGVGVDGTGNIPGGGK